MASRSFAMRTSGLLPGPIAARERLPFLSASLPPAMPTSGPSPGPFAARERLPFPSTSLPSTMNRASLRKRSFIRLESSSVVGRPLVAGPSSFVSPPPIRAFPQPPRTHHNSKWSVLRSSRSSTSDPAGWPFRLDPGQRSHLLAAAAWFTLTRSPRSGFVVETPRSHERCARNAFLLSACRSDFFVRFCSLVSQVPLPELANPTLPPGLHGCDCCSRFRTRTTGSRSRSTSPERSEVPRLPVRDTLDPAFPAGPKTGGVHRASLSAFGSEDLPVSKELRRKPELVFRGLSHAGIRASSR
jgi:hypothetical protein